MKSHHHLCYLWDGSLLTLCLSLPPSGRQKVGGCPRAQFWREPHAVFSILGRMSLVGHVHLRAHFQTPVAELTVDIQCWWSGLESEERL